ncbi:MAG: excinuclease ABC subunit C, partial [Myxococcales bacterium]|nr:excinuclease ABC subunit C [Myxococcales bacterium]
AMEGLAELLSERRGTLVTLVSPKRGPRRALVAMADDNAMHAFEEKQRVREDIERRLTDVQTRLRLPRLPRRIECLDISHHGGEDTVGVFAALSDGQIDRSRYRSFTVRRARGGDDFGAMHEVLSRRFLRSKGPSGGWEAPDLLVVDGGKGQLSVALSVLSDLQISEVPVVALAKEKETLLGEQVVDRVYLPGTKNPVLLRDSSPALQMLALVRDEAHRSSNELRKKVGKRRSLHSELDAIPGVGPKTRARLLRHFGSVRAIRTANRASLLEAGATRRQAEDILAALGEAPSPEPVLDAERDAVDNAFSEGSGEP